MEPNSRNLSPSRAVSTQHTVHSTKWCALGVRRIMLIAYCLVLSAALTGCESLQRKFTRKSKRPEARPNPIISFQDYSQAMTPLDRYRKHYLIFDYWNSELLAALQDAHPNPKRFKRASGEALSELEALKDLVTEDVATQMTPILEERATIHRQLQSGTFTQSQATGVWHRLESQTRQIHREFFWRDVEERLKPPVVQEPRPPEEHVAPN